MSPGFTSPPVAAGVRFRPWDLAQARSEESGMGVRRKGSIGVGLVVCVQVW